MNIAERRNAVTKLPPFEFQGEEINIEVRTHCLTPKFLQTIFDLQAGKDILGLSLELSKAITKWDITWQEPDKEPVDFPPNFENLSEICDQEFIGALLESISTLFSGNGQKPKPLVNGSAVSAK